MELYLVLIIVAVVFVTFTAILARYKRCPSDKILVIYGKTGKNKQGAVSSARCIHGGASSGLYSRAIHSWTSLLSPSSATLPTPFQSRTSA